jgi:hypothetical protein
VGLFCVEWIEPCCHEWTPSPRPNACIVRRTVGDIAPARQRPVADLATVLFSSLPMSVATTLAPTRPNTLTDPVAIAEPRQ